jgi:hypothetical protein
MKAAAGIIVVAMILLVVGPLLTIWCLNTLFPALAIPYTLATWAASALLGSALFAGKSKK